TERIELGTAILVAPLRNPLVTAIQVASVSVEAGGRFALGVGAGWLAEEFDAVGVPFERRGKVLDAWVDVVRSVWSGTLPVRDADGLF
ncbi:MAG: LLM class flavin-dependent oxidoreductase, partial [Actinobacteria bacterium]|nr:LLM class flavin-dependent oxidoreductase [Actinomycetota bacterium]NIU19289.1 LLM class flavin-dependent oxidoreductase [Actinomycetota bacterium]NIU71138.1 LLM class flavin-dependent oxidoreductase [Actinomycetota bacterium]NIW33093.1 LLM class flavin-dependent oxidoreductase [Actinomycetota bacterium]